MENSKGEKLERICIKEMDEILGLEFPILDKGFIRVIDYMGNDASIVQAARTSYGKGTKSKMDDKELIRYLLRHDHTTPFEMAELKLHLKVPMDAWRHWIRHRTANVNEYSTRYSIAIEDKQETNPDKWRLQAKRNKQGSEGFLDAEKGKILSQQERDLHEHASQVYHHRLDLGVAREQARKDLPLSTYTTAYWKIDSHNLMHFLYLRMDKAAQLEIRTYANFIGNEIMPRWLPITWDAFKDYKINAFNLSVSEQKILSNLIKGDSCAACNAADKLGFISYSREGLKRSLECKEFEDKLIKMNLGIPWLEEQHE